MAIRVNREIKFKHRIYVVEVVRGLWVTSSCFFKNIFGHILGLFGIKYGK